MQQTAQHKHDDHATLEEYGTAACQYTAQFGLADFSNVTVDGRLREAHRGAQQDVGEEQHCEGWSQAQHQDSQAVRDVDEQQGSASPKPLHYEARYYASYRLTEKWQAT